MKSLKEYILEARQKKVAIGHFNVSTLDALWSIYAVAVKLQVPVIIGVSEGERDYVGVRAIAKVVRMIREENNFPIFINADHTYSYERVQEAVDAGFDAVIIDGAQLSFEENVALTQKAVAYAKNKNPDILIEGELGYIGTSSKVLKELPKGAALDALSMTSPEQAKEFVAATGVDLLAPAVGNVHGMLSVGHDPRLDIPRIKAIHEATGVPLVLHGGSGTVDEDFVSAIDAGVSIIHINTELRVAYTKGLVIELQQNPEEVAPYKYLKPAAAALGKVAEGRLKLFSKI